MVLHGAGGGAGGGGRAGKSVLPKKYGVQM